MVCLEHGLLRNEVSQRQIVHHVLDLAHLVLDRVAASAESVVLQIQKLKAGKEILDELADEHRTLVVPKRDRVTSEARLKTSVSGRP